MKTTAKFSSKPELENPYVDPRNIYAPSPKALNLLERGGFEDPDGALLRERLANRARVPGYRLVVSKNIDQIIEQFELHFGPVSLRSSPPENEAAAHDHLVLIQSPDDVFGQLARVQDIVVAARKHALVLIDERHADYARRSAAPIASEFQNIVVLRSFENWAGLSGELNVAYAILPDGLSHVLQRDLSSNPPGALAAAAAFASLTDMDYLTKAMHKTMTDKMKLYRMLRKLNTLSPQRSNTNFVGSRIVRGDRDELWNYLNTNGFSTYRPLEPASQDAIRVNAMPPHDIAKLQSVLVEWGASL